MIHVAVVVVKLCRTFSHVERLQLRSRAGARDVMLGPPGPVEVATKGCWTTGIENDLWDGLLN